MDETPLPATRLILPGFQIDLDRAELRTSEGVYVQLRPRSFAVLRLLVENAGRLVHKDEIMDVVWDDATVTENSLTRCIADIRHALRDSERRLVRTVPRRGYSFAGTVAHVGAAPAAEAPSANRDRHFRIGPQSRCCPSAISATTPARTISATE